MIPRRLCWMVVLLIAALFSSWGARAGHAEELPITQTNVCGILNTNTTWSSSGSPYDICNSGVTVASGVTLTIQPGVVVRGMASSSSRLTVQGSLHALGTSGQGNGILFTGPAGDGTWGGFSFTSTSTTESTGSFAYVTIENAGSTSSSSGAIVTSSRGLVTIANSVIRNSPSHGIYTSGEGRVSISNTSFTGNARYPVYFLNGAVEQVLSGLSADGNGSNAVAIGTGTVAGEHLWESTGIPYHLVGTITVPVGARLTVQPGVTVQAENTGRSITMNGGTLRAEGTAASSITFTRMAGTEQWGGLRFNSSSGTRATGALRYVTVEHSGGTSSSSAGITVSGSDVTVANSVIRNSGSHGLYTSSGGRVIVSSTAFTGNAGHALYLNEAAVDHQLSGLTADGNGLNAISMAGGTLFGPHLWEAAGIPYHLRGSITLGSSTQAAELTIQAGTTVHFDTATLRPTLQVNEGSSLVANGSSTQRILFSRAGSTGEWGGIRLSGRSTNRANASLRWVTIEHAGTSGENNGALYVSEGVLVLADSLVGHSQTNGLFGYTGHAVTISNTRFTDHALAPLRFELYGSADPVLSNLAAERNGTNGIVLRGPGHRTVTGNHRWEQAGLPYIIDDSLRFGEGSTLTVDPGVEVRIKEFSSLGIGGTLHAVGTEAQQIRFTREAPADAVVYGIRVAGTPGSPASVTARHAIFDGIGGSPGIGSAMLEVLTGSATVSNSVFRNSASSGLDVDQHATLNLAHTSFQNNAEAALRVSTGTLRGLQLSNLSASGNGINGVHLSSLSVVDNQRLSVMGLPYYATGGLRVAQEGHLTLDQGVVLHLDTGFYVNGTLTAAGSAAQKIRLTGINQAPGAWWGLSVSGSSSSLARATLDHVIIENGGQQSSAALRTATAIVRVTNSAIRNGLGDGVHGAGGSPSDGDTLIIENTEISNHARYALYFDDESANPVLRNLSATGNGHNVIAVRGSLQGEHVWENAGLPYVVPEWAFGVDRNSTLLIEPGVEVQFGPEVTVNINGTLIATGTAAQPIRFTGFFQGASPRPGFWPGIRAGQTAVLVLDHCEIGYAGNTSGGGPTSPAALDLATTGALVQNCRIHNSTNAAIETRNNVAPFIRNNRIEQNVFGVRNSNGTLNPTVVDARHNWWGDPSGPRHPTLNPGGKGDAVSDHVLFDPWLTEADELPLLGGLMVHVSGDQMFQPGDTQDYVVFYNNQSTERIENAVVAVSLPTSAEYISNSGGGIFWRERGQLFWKLGTVQPGQYGILSVRARYFWGLPEGLRDSIQAFVGGTNINSEHFDVQPYLEYQPLTVTSRVTLDPAQINAELAASPQLADLYQRANGEGYLLSGAQRLTMETGEPATLMVMLRQDDKAVTFLRRQGEIVYATLVLPEGFRFRSTEAEIQFNNGTGEWEVISGAGMAEEVVASITSSYFAECMRQCIAEQLPGYIIGQVVKPVSMISNGATCAAAAAGDAIAAVDCAGALLEIPGVGEGVALGQCVSDCQRCNGDCNNPNCHCCKQDKFACNPDGFPYGWFGIHSITRWKCSPVTGRYLAGETIRTCAICEKCVEGANGPYCTRKSSAAGLLFAHVAHYEGIPQPTPQQAAIVQDRPASTSSVLAMTSGQTDSRCMRCTTARDPNAKYGPEGDVVPGQVMDYTITVENVGQAQAFGVFVMDELDEHFDLDTLVLPEGARLIEGTRTIIWTVGTLEPAGQPGAETEMRFSVRLKPDLPSGTVISNDAVVYFPSVPETTPTNTVVNVVQPLAATPQTLETPGDQAIAFTLSGRDAANSPLTYTVELGPLNGTLSGTAPTLIYTPAPNFSGQDRIRFTVNNGVMTSRPAEILINVLPSAHDHTAPRVQWTVPANGATVPYIPEARFSGPAGPLYAPAIQVQFSEALDVGTISAATARLTGPDGAVIPLNVSYDSAPSRAMLMSTAPLQQDTTYTVMLTSGITDRAGNPLPLTTFTFQTGDDAPPPPPPPPPSPKLFLPLVAR